MTDVVLHFTAGPIGVGLWCDSHNLPGRYEVDLFTISDAGVSRVATHSGCDCSREK